MARLGSLAKMVAAGSDENPAKRFADDLKQTIKRSQSEYKPSRFYKPSGVSGCIRKMYFERIGKSKQDDASTNLIGMGEVGTFRHEVIQNYLIKMSDKKNSNFTWVDVEEHLKENPVEGTRINESKKFKKKNETKCFNELLQLSFLCDGIIIYEGEKYIFEMKTETMFKYQKHTEAHEEHFLQAACYAMCLGVDKVMFLYENRDSLDFKATIFTPTEADYDAVVEKIQLCEDYVLKGEEPKIYCSSSYCPYCKKGERK